MSKFQNQCYLQPFQPTEQAGCIWGDHLKDKVFSDMSAEPLASWTIAELRTPPDNESRRWGYYDKPRAWESVGPRAGDVNELTRKFADQKVHKTANMPFAQRSLEDKLSAHTPKLLAMRL